MIVAMGKTALVAREFIGVADVVNTIVESFPASAIHVMPQNVVPSIRRVEHVRQLLSSRLPPLRREREQIAPRIN